MNYAFPKFIFLVFVSLSIVISAAAQSTRPAPELAVANLRLGAEDVNKAILQTYSPRYDNEQKRPQYFFYNGYGNQVMKVTAFSKEHPFLVVAIEVFAVGESYQKTHYQMKETNYFTSESGFFIGERASFSSLTLGIPNTTRPGDVIKKKGAPEADEKDKKTRTLRYRIGAVEELKAPGEINFGVYTAEYHFVKNKLRRFSIAVEAK